MRTTTDVVYHDAAAAVVDHDAAAVVDHDAAAVRDDVAVVDDVAEHEHPDNVSAMVVLVDFLAAFVYFFYF